jgi:predicted peptidase
MQKQNRFAAPFARLALFAFTLSLCAHAHAASVSDYQARSYRISTKKTIPYRLFIPKNYDKAKKYPLMLSLHGAGERGTNNTSQLNHEFTNFWANDSIQKDNPCFVVAPQCPPDPEWWVKSATFGNYDFDKTPITDNLQAVSDILDSLGREFNLDPDRIYISGMSMGGAGTWYMITKYPGRFAAAVPVCGGADTSKADIFNKIPIWTFHEVDDPTVPVHFTRDLAKAIKARGGEKFKYTEYPASMGFGHESWKPAAKDPELHRWVFQQVRATTASISPRTDRSARIAISGSASATPILRVDGLGRIRPDGARADRSAARYFTLAAGAVPAIGVDAGAHRE